MTSNYDKKRIIKNSSLMYSRMLVTMIFNLWATRLVLHNLGSEDMGIYGVVSGITALASFITDGTTTAIQRFIVFEKGKKESHENEVFCTAVNITLLISIFIFLFLELLSFFITDIANIPSERETAAKWIYQFAIISLIINFISIPYNSLIIAYERINIYAWLSIINVILSWGAAWLISMFQSSERLALYGFFCCITCVIVRISCQIYCNDHFDEAEYHFYIDKKMIKQMMKYSGITTFSGALQSITSQAIVLIINWIFGAAINAVYMIALQLKNSVLSFGFNIFKAISPQITKTYAENDREHCSKLVYEGAKFEALMVGAIMVPFIFKSQYILQLWLKNVPVYTREFCISTIFISLTYAIISPVSVLVQASGKIKRFMTIPDIFYLLTVTALSFTVAYFTKNPILTIVSIVITDMISCLLRIVIAQKETFFSIKKFVKQVISPVFTVLLFSYAVCYILRNILTDSIPGLIALLAANTIVLLFLAYFFVITIDERIFIKENARKIISLIRK